MLRNLKCRKSGFTLVEITLVVGILVVLSAIVLVTLNIRGNSAAANNVKRKIDLEQIQKALDLRAQETGDSLPANLPTKAACIGNGGSETFDLQSINWSESVPSPDTDIKLSARTCSGSTGGACDNPSSWFGDFTNPAGANSLASIADAPFFQYKADFVDNTYPTGVTIKEALIKQDCTGYGPKDCYTLLSAWETDWGGITDWNSCAAGDLTAGCANAVAVAKIDGAWSYPESPSSTMYVNGWTTDATHYIRIYTTPAARHNGKWDDTKYRIVPLGIADVLQIDNNYVIIDGLQIAVPDGISSDGVRVQANNVTVSKNIIKGMGSLSRWGIEARSMITTVFYAVNNIIYDFVDNRCIEQVSTSGATVYLYNNTLFNCKDGINSSTTNAIVKNNIYQSNGISGADGFRGSFNALSDYNISNITADAPSVSYRNGQATNVLFIDTTDKDFHLASSDSYAKDAGTDTDPAFNTDVDSQVRPIGSAWDIGADEFGTSAPDYRYILKDVDVKLILSGSSYSYFDTTYNDFIKGIASSPLVVKDSAKPSDVDSGVVENTNSINPVPYFSSVFSGNCYNLTTDLAPLYLGAIPKDPKIGTDENTGYLISVDPATKVVCVKAPGAENDEIIENCRK